MITSRLLALLFWMGMALLQGCSSEENLPKNSSKDAVGKQNADYSKASVNSQTVVTSDPERQEPVPPSRSELRVMSEEAKVVEAQAKTVIQQFDMNLNNIEQRKAAEAKFKSMLPEYKEKMLQLGKAQLQQDK